MEEHQFKNVNHHLLLVIFYPYICVYIRMHDLLYMCMYMQGNSPFYIRFSLSLSRKPLKSVRNYLTLHKFSFFSLGHELDMLA